MGLQSVVEQKVPLPENRFAEPVQPAAAVSVHDVTDPAMEQHAPAVAAGQAPAAQVVQAPRNPPLAATQALDVVMEQVPPLQHAPSTSSGGH